ncbi:MAG: HAD family phosphatase, partial [Pseudomonadota bacterium]|nr:HAD family phosphatase [Pseudomonadota bacterium]
MPRARAAFRAAIFDMDGLLLDTERPVRTAWLHAADSVGMPLSDTDYLALVGLNHPASQARLLAHFGADPERLAVAAAAAQAWLAGAYG